LHCTQTNLTVEPKREFDQKPENLAEADPKLLAEAANVCGYFRNAAVYSPKDPRCYTDYGVFVEKAYGINGWEIAGRAYASAMALAPTDPHNLCESARFLHVTTGNSERAEYLLIQGIESGKTEHPDTPKMLMQLAMLRVMCPGLPLNGMKGKRPLGPGANVKMAEMLLRTAIMLDPSSEQIEAMLHKILSDPSSWESAWEYAEVSIQKMATARIIVRGPLVTVLIDFLFCFPPKRLEKVLTPD
jgi:hypothetical protein